MYDHSQRTYSADNIKAKSAATSETERRSGDRQPFTAAAEVVDLGSGARFSTRTTDLGSGGCFVDTIVPFPVDSKVRVTIRREKLQFEAVGLVVYSQAGLGMGIAFDGLDRKQSLVLDQWLYGSTRTTQQSDTHSNSPVDRPAVSIGSDHAVLVRLVRLMIIKGILSEAEGSSIFNDPVFF
jgi:hypothetical protein